MGSKNLLFLKIKNTFGRPSFNNPAPFQKSRQKYTINIAS